MKPPYIQLYVKDFAFDINGMTKSQIGQYMLDLLEAYKSEKIPEKYLENSAFLSLKKALTSYVNICKKNKANRNKSICCADQWSTSRQRVVNQSSTTLVKPEPITNNHIINNHPTNLEKTINEDTKKESFRNENSRTDTGRNASSFESSITFEEFWNEYPEIGRTGKQKTFEAYCKALTKAEHIAIMFYLRKDDEKSAIWKFKYSAERWLNMRSFVRKRVAL